MKLWQSASNIGSYKEVLGAALYTSLFCLFQGFKDNLHAVFCLAENSVGPAATRPDDIHILYSGKWDFFFYLFIYF